MKRAALLLVVIAITQGACGKGKATGNITQATLTAVEPRVLVPGATDAGVPPTVVGPAVDAGLIDEGPETLEIDITPGMETPSPNTQP